MAVRAGKASRRMRSGLLSGYCGFVLWVHLGLRGAVHRTWRLKRVLRSMKMRHLWNLLPIEFLKLFASLPITVPTGPLEQLSGK